jgi:hypothetical protein
MGPLLPTDDVEAGVCEWEGAGVRLHERPCRRWPRRRHRQHGRRPVDPDGMDSVRGRAGEIPQQRPRPRGDVEEPLVRADIGQPKRSPQCAALEWHRPVVETCQPPCLFQLDATSRRCRAAWQRSARYQRLVRSGTPDTSPGRGGHRLHVLRVQYIQGAGTQLFSQLPVVPSLGGHRGAAMLRRSLVASVAYPAGPARPGDLLGRLRWLTGNVLRERFAIRPRRAAQPRRTPERCHRAAASIPALSR